MRLVCVTFCIDFEKIKQLALSKSKLLPSLMRCRRQTRWLSSSSWWRKDNRSLRRLPRMRRRASSCWESFTATRNILRACWKIKVPCHSGLVILCRLWFWVPPLSESHLHPRADLTQGTTRSGEPLKDVIQDCLRNLNTCTELWGQEKPIGSSARETKNRVAKNDKPSPITTSEQNQCVLKSLEEINEGEEGLCSNLLLSVFLSVKEKKHTAWHKHVCTDLSSGNTEACIKKADEVMKMILGCSERDMPNKKVLLGKLHNCIGNAYLEIGDIDKALEHHQKDLELAMQWWVIEEM